jgi:periplasmic protein TonB
MNEGIRALSVSVLFHVVIVGLFGFLSFNHTLPRPECMTVNFTVEIAPGAAGDLRNTPARTVPVKGGEQKRRDNSARTTTDKPERPALSSLSETREQEMIDRQVSETTMVDSTGQKQAFPGNLQGSQQDSGYHEGVSLSGLSSGTSNTSGSSSKVLDYGRGGPDENSFYFIRETVMKNIKYPERARRMGWEGKVVLSFVVLENGAVKDVKITGGSGYRTLDDETRAAVERITFKQKIPCRLVISLPVEYRLK